MIDTIENKLYLQPILHEKTINVLPQHIYITSDEEIKEGDWIYNEEREPSVIQSIGKGSLRGWIKIILTTDPDLIKDGVQAIDGEFSEWFVKNPSCEFVDVSHQLHKDEPLYKIIIPREEPKQESYICPHTKIQCDDECCVSAEDCHIKASLSILSEPKQETLEDIKLEEVHGTKYCQFSVVENKLAIIYRNQEKLLTAIKLLNNGK